jgi:hypothetical protein
MNWEGAKLTLANSQIHDNQSGIILSEKFSIDCHNNEISQILGDESDSPLIDVNDQSIATFESDVFSGNCLVAISARSGSSVSCTRVTIQDINAGITVSEGSSLRLKSTTFQNIRQSAIMAHDGAVLEISEQCSIDNCESIGLIIQNDVRGFVKDCSISGCAVIGAHAINNSQPFVFERCSIGQSLGNGVAFKSVSVKSTDCKFIECKRPEDGEFGVELREANTTITFSRCSFNGCDSGLVISEGKGIATNCKFEDNDYGLSVYNGGKSQIKDCGFSRNGTGATVSGSSGEFSGCNFTEHREIAFWADSGADGNVIKSVVTKSQKVGICIEGQVGEKVTEFTFTDCKVIGTTETAGIGVKENGVVHLKSCTVSETKTANVEVQSRGKVDLESCNLSNSQQGVGLQVMGEGSRVEARKCTIGKQKLSGVLLESGAWGKISECDTCGVCIRAGCDGELTRNRIHDMATVGIQVEGGTPSIVENQIRNCKTYGIHIVAGAEPQVIDNEFQGSGSGDVNRE